MYTGYAVRLLRELVDTCAPADETRGSILDAPFRT